MSKSKTGLIVVYQMFADMLGVIVLFGVPLLIVLMSVANNAKSEADSAREDRDKAVASGEKAKGDAKEDRRRREKAEEGEDNERKKREKAEEGEDNERKKREDAEQQAAKLNSRKIDVLLNFDGSASMETGRLPAMETLLSLSRVLPAAAEQLRVACCFYTIKGRQCTGLVPIVSPDQDDGKSVTKLLDFLRSKKLVPGEVDNFSVISQAIAQSNRDFDPDRRQVIVLVTDAEFSESGKIGRLHTVHQASTAIRNWKRRAKEERFFVAYNPNRKRTEANSELRQLAIAGRGEFVTDGTRLLEVVLAAALKQE